MEDHLYKFETAKQAKDILAKDQIGASEAQLRKKQAIVFEKLILNAPFTSIGDMAVKMFLVRIIISTLHVISLDTYRKFCMYSCCLYCV